MTLHPQETTLREDVAVPVRSFRPDVEGLRAIAIATVVLYHYQLPPFRGGYVGVDIFFVISGFVITQMLMRERIRTSGTSLADFYARRIRRILPASSVVLITTTVASFLLLGHTAGRAVAGDARAAALFFANVHFAQTAGNYLTSTNIPSPLLHFWSLSIEEQFYFVWPSALLVICAAVTTVPNRVKLAAFLGVITVASLVLSSQMTASNPTNAYYSSFTRAGELALGALVAVLMPHFARMRGGLAAVLSWLGFVGIFVAAIWFNDQTPFPGTAVLLPIGATALVIASGAEHRNAGAERVLGVRSFLWLGALSYSLYLWHWPIYVLVWDKIGHVPQWPTRVALVGVAIIVSVASLRFLENPIRHSKALMKRRSLTYLMGTLLILTCVAVSILLPALGGSDVAWNGKPQVVATQAQLDELLKQGAALTALPKTVVPLDKLDTDFPDDHSGCDVDYRSSSATGNRPSNDACTWGDPHGTRAVALFGDSHAVMWLPAFDELGKREHFRVVLFARAACYTASLDLWSYRLNAPGTGCSKFRRWAIQAINNLNPVSVVLSDHAGSSNRDFHFAAIPNATYLAGVLETYRALEAPGRTIVQMATTPDPPQDPSLCLSAHSTNIQACSFPRAQANAQGPRGLNDAAAAGGATFLPVVQWFCTETTCPMIVNHEIVYFNNAHISAHYAATLDILLGTSLAKIHAN